MKSQIIFSVSFNLAYRYHVYNAVDDYRVVLFVDVLNIAKQYFKPPIHWVIQNTPNNYYKYYFSIFGVYFIFFKLWQSIPNLPNEKLKLVTTDTSNRFVQYSARKMWVCTTHIFLQYSLPSTHELLIN